MKDGLQLAWNGVELLLKKAEKSLAGTPFQVPVGIINTLIELKTAVSDNNNELDAQITRTRERLDIVKDINDNNTDSDEFMEEFTKKLAVKLSDLDQMAKKATWKKTLENEQDKSEVNSIFKYIDEQTKDFQMRLALKIDQNTKDLQQSLDQLQLDSWPHSDRAMYDANPDDVQTLSRELCTQNTRVAVLEKIRSWAQDSSFSCPQVFWLTGHAGSGKSTIAYTIAHDFGEGKSVLNILQASFFCSRQFENTRHQKYIIPTLVYQLAYHSQSFAKSLLAADKMSVNKQLSKQMQGLLIGPWKKALKNRSSELPPYLIVIDALDELEGKAGAQFLRELLLTINDGHLKGLKFLVTSWPDPALAQLCRSFPSNSVCRLQDVSQEQADKDIMTYLHDALPVFQNKPELEELGKKANGLFIYASTAVRYMSSGTSGEQHDLMRQLLNPTNDMKFSDFSYATGLIDHLYHQILSEAFVQVQKNHIPARLKILHTILCAEERISTSVTAGLLSTAKNVKDMEERADNLVKKLHAVLYIKDDKVFWYHASFPDFIFAQGQSSQIDLTYLHHPSSYTMDMSCDPASHHALLAHSCFDIMLRELHFNICNLPSSFLDDSQVPNLETCIKEKISDVLQYACQQWAQHVIKSIPKEHKNILPKIGKFLEIHVLFWIEAMNLLQSSKQCHLMLQQVFECITKSINETANFAAYFSASQAALSTPHLYISSLATWLNDSSLTQGWKKFFPLIPSVTGDRRMTMSQVNILQTNIVGCVAFSHDSKWIVSGSYDKSVRVWDASSGTEMQQLHGHNEEVTSVAFSPDNKSIVSGSSDKSVRVWDASSGAELQQLHGHNKKVTSVAFSSDGKWIISGSDDKSVRVWNVSNGATLKQLIGHNKRVTSVAFSQDGKWIASGSDDKSVRVWDSFSGAELQQLNGHASYVASVAFSPDGKCIVSGSDDESVRVWDASSGTELQHFNGHRNGITSVAFSPDGKCIVSGSDDKSVRVWDLSNGVELQHLNGHSGSVRSVAFSPDGKCIASGSDDKFVRVWIWNASSGAEMQQSDGHTSYITSVSFSSNSKWIASGSDDKSVRVWDVFSGTLVQQYNGHNKAVKSVAFSPDGTLVVSGSDDRSVQVWEASSGTKLQQYNGHKGGVTSVAFSLNGKCIVSGANDNSLRVCDTSSGREIQQLNGHKKAVRSVAYSPDSKWIVSGSDDNSVRVWDASSGTELHQLNSHTDYVRSVAFSPDSKWIVSGSDDNSVRVWDASDGVELKCLDGHSGYIRSVAFSPDGKCIVSGSDDKSVQVWDASSGTKLQQYNGHKSGVTSVVFSPDGKCIVSGSNDKSVRVWNAFSGAELPQTISDTAWVRSVAFSKDGKCIVSGDSSMIVYDTPYSMWTSTYNGWIVLPLTSHQVMWLPDHVCNAMYHPLNTLIIPSHDYFHVDLSFSTLGEQWAQCYNSPI
ncbi:hypothetical protein H2248_008140 [Termitomyces sp. 'cryptogamus']|nr:hypothetical protein H2248_008140 [Termitomyces sp. 'cryptogamus']